MANVRESNIIQSKDQKISLPTSLSISDNSGKHVSQAFIRKNIRKFSDVRDFIRIPPEGFRVMATLEKTELKILCYIFENLIYGELKVEIPIEPVKTYYSYVSRNPIYSGIVGLINKGLIAKIENEKSLYYINPLYFYKGTIIKEFFEFLEKNSLRKISLKNDDLENNLDFSQQKEIV